MKVGLADKTTVLVPVSSVIAAAKLADDGVAKNVATPVPSPEIPELTGKPVQLVSVPDVGVPRSGVTNVGEVAKTNAPVPVSSVTAEIRFALEGVARKVAIPVPRPEIPELTGRPVQLVNVPEVGVPNRGVTNVGLVANTNAPVPVSSVTAAIKFADEEVARKVAMPVAKPLTPEEIGSPVQLVSVPEVGVPRIGVTRVGLVANTHAPVPVSSVIAEIRLAEDGVAKKVATPVPKPEIPELTGNPVQLVSVPEVGVPNKGVTKVGEVANTRAPVPVSSVTAEIKLALEGVPKNVATPVPRPLTPVLIGRPVQLVKVPDDGVPSTGVVKVGEVSVLLVNVSEPANVAKSLSDKAVLN